MEIFFEKNREKDTLHPKDVEKKQWSYSTNQNANKKAQSTIEPFTPNR
jgi:hypothetical protein